jgi:hypothetical protein
MAILQISRIQHRRGLQEDLPQLASAELGWSIDTRKLYIGNGTVDEGAPTEGVTEILTENSILDFTVGFASNLTALESAVTSLDNRVTSLEAGVTEHNFQTLTTSGSIRGFSANNIVINYTCHQGTTQRMGILKAARYLTGTTVSWDDEFTETGSTDLSLSVSGNSSYMSLDYSTTTSTSFLYNVVSIG